MNKIGTDKILSALTAVAYLLAAVGSTFERYLGLILYLAFSVICIWFADGLSDYFEMFHEHGFRRYFFHPTPPLVVRIMAWVMLGAPSIGIASFGLDWFRGR